MVSLLGEATTDESGEVEFAADQGPARLIVAVLHRPLEEHDVVLCDRSVLDNYSYLVHAVGSVRAWEQFLDHWIPTYDLLVHVPVFEHPAFDGVRAVDPGFQDTIDTLLEGMISARALRPLRLDPSARDGWCDAIVAELLPKLEPTMPLFPEDDRQ